MEKLNRISELADKWLKGTISEDEAQEFEAWYNAEPDRVREWTKDASEEELRLRMLARLKGRIEERAEGRIEEPVAAGQAAVVPMASRRRMVVRWAVAASVIGLIGTGIYFLAARKTEKPGEVAKAVGPRDIPAPAANRATITLAGGQKIILDSVGNGTLATQSRVNIIKNGEGQIAYSPLAGAASSADQAVMYNTLTNPRGSKVISMTLADGSRVWLNAGSSVTYPVAFAGKGRSVEVTGEAYFAVTRNAKQPFKVAARGVEIEDLGTEFNVSAYEDEAVIKTTLIEGSVKVALPPAQGDAAAARPGDRAAGGPGNREVILKPGEQAQSRHSDLQLVNPDLGQVTAWRNGLFNFNKVSLAEAMRHLARWYDVEVIYEQGIPDITFGGEMERNMSLAGVLKFLNRTGAHFKLEGRTIVVTH